MNYPDASISIRLVLFFLELPVLWITYIECSFVVAEYSTGMILSDYPTMQDVPSLFPSFHLRQQIWSLLCRENIVHRQFTRRRNYSTAFRQLPVRTLSR